MNEIWLTVAGRPVTWGEGLFALIVTAIALLCVVIVLQGRASRRRERLTNAYALRQDAHSQQLLQLTETANQMTGRMQTMAEVLGSRQADLGNALATQIDSATQRLGQSMQETREQTQKRLGALQERLVVIDRAQQTMTDLSSDIVSLQDILANKQTRGAFGQGQMEALVRDGLPREYYTFQATLSNGKRPDCLVAMPNGQPSLAIDAKFPLEAFERLRDAQSAPEVDGAKRQLRQDFLTHVKDIASKYLIPGETQDMALMFLPSESLFADVYELFPDLLSEALKRRVIITSPSLLRLAIQTIQAILRDVRMREEAHVIQREVTMLVADTSRLFERVLNLQKHFATLQKDVDLILTSADKIYKRGRRIEDLDFDDEPSSVTPAEPPEVQQRKPERVALK